MTLLPSQFSDAFGFGVNGANIVGDAGGVATLWRNGVPFDLNTLTDLPSGWTLFSARAINATNEIAGYASNGQDFRGFLLTSI